jgi:hypothetical protein
MSTETGLLILSGIIGLIAVSMLKPSSKPYFGLLTKNKDGSFSLKLSPAARKKKRRPRKRPK